MNTFVVLQLVVVSVAALALLWLGRRAGAVSGGDPLRLHRRYQPRSVLVAVGTLVASAGLRWAGGVRVEPLGFLGVGNLDVPARDIGPLADPGDAWLTVGLRFGLIATVVTAVVVYLQVDKRPPLRAVIAVLPVATVVSLVNAGVEELIFRLALVQGLHDLVSAPTLAICSGVLFGVPHYFGNPGKIPGC